MTCRRAAAAKPNGQLPPVRESPIAKEYRPERRLTTEKRDVIVQQPRGLAMNEQWEYKIVSVNAEQWTPTGLPADLNQRFDEFGADGWALFGTNAIQRPSLFTWGWPQTVAFVADFKRRVCSEAPR